MKKSILVAIVVGMLGWSVYEFIFASNEKENKTTAQQTNNSVEANKVGIRKGELAPDFELTILDGETVKLSDYKGKLVMLSIATSFPVPMAIPISAVA